MVAQSDIQAGELRQMFHLWSIHATIYYNDASATLGAK
jgi:hypothetical protein